MKYWAVRALVAQPLSPVVWSGNCSLNLNKYFLLKPMRVESIELRVGRVTNIVIDFRGNFRHSAFKKRGEISVLKWVISLSESEVSKARMD